MNSDRVQFNSSDITLIRYFFAQTLGNLSGAYFMLKILGAPLKNESGAALTEEDLAELAMRMAIAAARVEAKYCTDGALNDGIPKTVS